MKKLMLLLVCALVIGGSAFTQAQAPNIDPIVSVGPSGNLLVDLERFEGPPIFIMQDGRILVPKPADPAKEQLWKAAMTWLNEGQNLQRLQGQIAEWNLIYSSQHQPTVSRAAYYYSRLQGWLNDPASGNGRVGALQLIQQDATYHTMAMPWCPSCETQMNCCVDSGDGKHCKFCDCWKDCGNCCNFSPGKITGPGGYLDPNIE